MSLYNVYRTISLLQVHASLFKSCLSAPDVRNAISDNITLYQFQYLIFIVFNSFNEF